MKILIADSFPDTRIAKLKTGHQVTFNPTLDGDSLISAIADNEILIVRSTVVSKEAIESATNLKLIIRAGAGTNTIDKSYAADCNIRVCNVPGANAVAVAELTLGLIIAIDRNLAGNFLDLRAGQWHKKKYSTARGLFGQRLGILGFGAIGQAVAIRANAFGLKVCILAKKNRSDQANKVLRICNATEYPSQSELLNACDIISLHLPVTHDTEKLVDEKFLATMQQNAMLINTSRGELVDEESLLKAMHNKGIRPGLDVYYGEPKSGAAAFQSALANHPNVHGTHHIGASTAQAQTAVADGVLQVIESFQRDALIYCVNN